MAKSTKDLSEKATPRLQRRASTTSSVRRNRLPTLQEVLSRKTAAPLDLYCYVRGVYLGTHDLADPS